MSAWGRRNHMRINKYWTVNGKKYGTNEYLGTANNDKSYPCSATITYVANDHEFYCTNATLIS